MDGGSADHAGAVICRTAAGHRQAVSEGFRRDGQTAKSAQLRAEPITQRGTRPGETAAGGTGVAQGGVRLCNQEEGLADACALLRVDGTPFEQHHRSARGFKRRSGRE